MATREHQAQSIVGDRLRRELLEWIEVVACHEERLLRAEVARSPRPVDGLVARGGEQPAHWIVRDSVSPPSLEGDEPRFLEDVLGKIEVVADAHECRHRPPPDLAVEAGRRGPEIDLHSTG